MMICCTDAMHVSLACCESSKEPYMEKGFFLEQPKIGKAFALSQKSKMLGRVNGFRLIGIHCMQGWTATTRHGVTRKRSTKNITAHMKSV